MSRTLYYRTPHNLVRILASILALASGAAFAEDIPISPGSDIQAAINGASDGDRIVFAPGTYHLSSTLLFNAGQAGKTITLLGSAGASNTILDAGNSTNHIDILTAAVDPDSHIVIDGLTFRNGSGPEARNGGAILNNAVDLTVRNCIFQSNQALSRGGAIRVSVPSGGTDVDVTIEDSQFLSNSSGGNGGALYLSAEAGKDIPGALVSANIQRNVFIGNQATGLDNPNGRGSGGAISSAHGNAITISNSTFEGNTATFAGGAVSIFGSSATITDNSFGGSTPAKGNSASGAADPPAGGAIHCEAQTGKGTATGSMTFTVRDNLIQHNSAGNKGGGIDVFAEATASVVTIESNTIEDNDALQGGGIAYFATDTLSTASILGNIIRSNSAGLQAGVVASKLGALDFVGNLIQGNSIPPPGTTDSNTPGVWIVNALCAVVGGNSFISNANDGAGSIHDGSLRLKNVGPCTGANRSGVIENNFFLANTGDNAAALAVTGTYRVDLVGNTFTDNQGIDAVARIETPGRVESNIFDGDGASLWGVRFAGTGYNAQVNANNFVDLTSGPVIDPGNALASGAPPGYAGYTTVNALNASGASATGNKALTPAYRDLLGGDLHLEGSSPLTDQGSCTHFSTPKADHDGDPRPTGSNCDMGADEVATGELSVILAGGGSGTVSSNPAGIDCPGDCDEAFASDLPVRLTALPAEASIFEGWSGDPDCSDGLVQLNAAKSCTATFSPLPLLQISKTGSGSGRITSSPTGIDCGSDCSESYASDTLVVLAPNPDADSAFGGWSGDPDCDDGQVTMAASRSCTASFALLRTLEISILGPGTGLVASDPGTIDCGSVCIDEFIEGTTVDLASVPSFGSEFGGWGGPTDCADGSLGMLSDLSCTATFKVCSIDPINNLPPQDVSGSVNLFEACNRLTAGAGNGGFNILSSAAATFRAGNEIILEDGFSVGTNAEFTAVIGPPDP